jgi:hypothetical protein
MKDVEYPIGIVDALRDALLNGVYLYFKSEGPQQQGAMTILSYAILTEDGEALRRLTEVAKNYKRGFGGAIYDWFTSSSRPKASLGQKGQLQSLSKSQREPQCMGEPVRSGLRYCQCQRERHPVSATYRLPTLRWTERH